MSTGETAVPHRDALARTPSFELSCLYDDMASPEEVTIFYPTGRRTATEWITADVGAAVGLDESR